VRTSSQLIHALAANKLIQDLEDCRGQDLSQLQDSFEHKRILKAKVVRLGTTFGIASSHTSFVAVDESEVDARRKELMPVRPLARPHTALYAAPPPGGGASPFLMRSMAGGPMPRMKMMRAGAPAPAAARFALYGGAKPASAVSLDSGANVFAAAPVAQNASLGGGPAQTMVAFGGPVQANAFGGPVQASVFNGSAASPGSDTGKLVAGPGPACYLILSLYVD
jgi:hypothetical protein